METKILIKELDYIRLSKTIVTAKNERSTDLKNLEYLAHEIKRTSRVKSENPEYNVYERGKWNKMANMSTRKPKYYHL